MMKIRQLEYFNALCRLKSFSKVAKKFKVSQPTVSYAIKSLENSLDFALIARNQSHAEISLTKEGELFNVYSENALQQLAMGKSALKSLANNRITFGISATLSRFFNLTQHISAIEKALGNEISLIEDGSREITQKISLNSLVLALFGSIKELQSDHLDLKKIASFSFKLAVSNSHPFAKHPQIQLNRAERENFVVFNEHFIHNEVFWRYINNSKIVPNVLAEVSDIASFKNFIVKKNAIGILIDLWKPDELNLVELDEGISPQFHLYLGKQKQGKATDEAFNKVKEYILEQLK